MGSYKKYFKILVFILVFFITFEYVGLNSNKVMASDGFGYANINFIDVDSREEISPVKTLQVPLKNGSGKIKFSVDSIEGYTLKYVMKENGERLANPYEVIVDDNNTSSNALQIYAFYKNKGGNVSNIEITYVGETKSTGHISEMDKTVISVPKGKKYSIAPNSVSPLPNWKFKATKLDGNVLSNKLEQVTFIPNKDNHKLQFWYEAEQLATADLILVVVDNELDKNGNVVKQPDGKDYFHRVQHNLKNVQGTTNKTVSSGGGKSNLEIAFATVDNIGGNPIAAMTNYTQKEEASQLGNPPTINANVRTDAKTWYVHFYWKPKGTDIKPPEGKGIIFNPNETPWTNLGKTGEGRGRYPVEVKYTGENPARAKGSASWRHYEEREDYIGPDGEPISRPPIIKEHNTQFDVEFPLDSITVTGDGSAGFSGNGGTMYIEKEGEGLSLQATGKWGQANYSSPSSPDGYDSLTGTTIPDAPPPPGGQSGKYNIDWTKPEIHIDNPQSKWVKSPVPYPVRVTVDDNLSGFATGSVDVIDSSHYGRNNSDSLPHAQKSYSKTVMLSDGMYKIAINATDRATNSNADSKNTYYIDGTKPEVEFNIKPGLFSVENGAVRKPSKKGIDDGFYGELTASDNLSGVAKIQYGWTFENKKDDVKYEVIYTSPYTYTDRYEERIKKEIEKPVGDNVFLHVELWDTSGNYTYKVFGPYEDPIKLRDFQVTDVRDPKWQEVFWKDNKPTGVHFKADKLPLDNKSNPKYKNADMKKGYAFFFDLTSEYMYREEDKITIRPTFYYINGNKKFEVDMYYQLNNNPFIKCGSEEDTTTLNLKIKNKKINIGKLSQLTLTKNVRVCKGREWLGKDGWKHKYPADVQYKDGKEQYWYGKYFIPQTAQFVEKGKEPRPENILDGGEILINFEILGYKNGIETLSKDQIFAYIPTQWKKEGGPKDSKYNEGDIIIYNNKKSTLDDFKTQITY
ncbi:hypothetical protein [Clostridium faecium]|uniref:Uncharacterized protein n=1 Tax=Clostridium faecium TaxID=2762223 RepID=A0ABR8YNY7_9CLOT|nr:hypothetical protein [Clostridium faecium]MBD8045852.1 hypothetical protein [Clostridium faecium]